MPTCRATLEPATIAVASLVVAAGNPLLRTRRLGDQVVGPHVMTYEQAVGVLSKPN